MPTREELNSVIRRIEWLRSMSYFREEGKTPETASDCSLPWWEDLSRAEQQSVLEADVDWEGFSESQEDDVIRRVLDSEDSDFWMNGIEPDDGVRQVTDALNAEFSGLMRDIANPPRFDEYDPTQYARGGKSPDKGRSR